MNKLRAYGTVILLAHGIVLALHECAHRDLHIYLPLLKYVYAYIVIVFAPLIGTLLLFTKTWWRLGVWIFLLSMIGSLFFGVYHHFVMVSNDHVSHAPAGTS